MPCYHPLQGWRSRFNFNPKTGRHGITFNLNDAFVEFPVTVPCGQCIGCRLERSKMWAVRCMHESQLHDKNCFLTLTYNDENLPTIPCIDMETGEILETRQPSLNKRDICLFMKDLRKRFGAGIRFFQCGEYGEKFARPHHHMILFGFDFPDKTYWCVKRGSVLYRSKILERLWPYGHCSIGKVTFESAAYVARYITKKVNGQKQNFHYEGRQPEFITMSRRPGIAHDWIEKYGKSVYALDQVVIRGGINVKPPRYYDNQYDLTDHQNFIKIKSRRKIRAAECNDNTLRRLLDRETVAIAKLRNKQRIYEMESG